ncbi:unnamed protein product [Spirodela intermedia]|uniref:TF-B3 domain-containing protein n=1 Tax=Spirodela intermedia TaxID=51605 RepID=A0A7I8J662_SPIIN|nr:unnamed protein product [Spirodela intermedia]CAA6665245.1 unnamed protein product [Spirodela intermedia]
MTRRDFLSLGCLVEGFLLMLLSSLRSLALAREISPTAYTRQMTARAYAEETAKALQSQLASECPNFIKLMLQSHVTGDFGDSQSLLLEALTQEGYANDSHRRQREESSTLYLAEKNGLSAGWRGFAISHELVDGDAVIFELVSRATFKVHIIRQSGYYEAGTEVQMPGPKRKGGTVLCSVCPFLPGQACSFVIRNCSLIFVNHTASSIIIYYSVRSVCCVV